MRKILFAMFLICVCSGPVYADALDNFLDNLNVQAVADSEGFSLQLSSHFGIPGTDVELVIGSVIQPADAFLILQLWQWTGVPVSQVLEQYHASHGQGWGVLAKSLGIKPGSAEFHQLKNGDFSFSMPGATPGNKGKGKDKDKNKDKGDKGGKK